MKLLPLNYMYFNYRSINLLVLDECNLELHICILYILEAVRAIRVLAFDEDNQTRMVTDKGLDVVGVLENLKKQCSLDPPQTKQNRTLATESSKALWNMRKTLTETDGYTNLGNVKRMWTFYGYLFWYIVGSIVWRLLVFFNWLGKKCPGSM